MSSNSDTEDQSDDEDDGTLIVSEAGNAFPTSLLSDFFTVMLTLNTPEDIIWAGASFQRRHGIDPGMIMGWVTAICFSHTAGGVLEPVPQEGWVSEHCDLPTASMAQVPDGHHLCACHL